MNAAIYTRTGDTGHTRLADGSEVDKFSVRVEAYGTIDEANSWLGRARAACTDPKLQGILVFLSHRYFNCSCSIANPIVTGAITTDDDDINAVEQYIDYLTDALPPLSGFILPGGSLLASVLHVCRTVTRRAERRLWELAQIELVDAHVLKFFNRVSDLLFICARYADKLEGRSDVLWDKHLPPPRF